ncbi:amino acid ABC transporter permease [Rhizobium sp. LC145]|uniref:amino acid ABC transporter permease n=1 Tax=Rhizobium sp. LC145 TaxID=1120688 RepID=UPI0010C9A5EE|nr:amino acid ABC transporter permease [Rhizobium sp. LC145]TKT57777.1 amino acid ABC transporter permease [Rhizobiaceae bacterium LC148]
MDFFAFLEQLWIARFVILNGLSVTVSISLLAIVFGSIAGVFVGLVLTYGSLPLRFVVRGYIDIVRGTPVLVLVLASYYVSSAVGFDLGPFAAGVLALAIFCSSHVGEIVRGGLQAIPIGQTEAAKAIGLTFSQTFANVLWPQALRQFLPTWVNTAAEMVKASTLLSVIGVAELLLRTQEIISRNFMSLQFYFFAGLLYFVVNFAIERFGKYVERKTAVPT